MSSATPTPLAGPLDVTPEYTFSTIQFSNEVLNTVIASLITVFILVNIGSAVSKAIYFTRSNTFRYDSWLRAYIFANSDDPLRILSWLSRRYVYRDPKWARYPNKLRYSRLVLPLLSRALIFIASLVSVAVTIPDSRRMVGCVNNDYVLTLGGQPSFDTQNLPIFCFDVPLNTRRGDVASTAAYCYCNDAFLPQEVPDLTGQTRVAIIADERSATIKTELQNEAMLVSYSFYVEWKRANSSRFGETFRSDLNSSFDGSRHETLVLEALRDPEWGAGSGQACEVSRRDSDGVATELVLDCEVDVSRVLVSVERYVRSAMTWSQVQRGRIPERIKFDSNEAQGERSSECPIELKISRPIVNIVPLAIMLVIWILINSLVSFFTRKHGNALDAGFHIIKEALGHDTTSNPLENCVERNEVMHVPLRKWKCGSGGAHYGFIGREGDIPVTDFDEKTVVSGCSRVAIELDRAAALVDAPVGFAPPGASPPSQQTWHAADASAPPQTPS